MANKKIKDVEVVDVNTENEEIVVAIEPEVETIEPEVIEPIIEVVPEVVEEILVEETPEAVVEPELVVEPEVINEPEVIELEVAPVIEVSEEKLTEESLVLVKEVVGMSKEESRLYLRTGILPERLK